MHQKGKKSILFSGYLIAVTCSIEIHTEETGNKYRASTEVLSLLYTGSVRHEISLELMTTCCAVGAVVCALLYTWWEPAVLEASRAVLVFEGINGKLKHDMREFFISLNKNALC